MFLHISTLTVIVVVSDVHLGYDKSDKDNFSNFVSSELTKLNKNDHLVLLGDILDFWRGNCVDVSVEYKKGNTISDLRTTNQEGIIIKKLYDLLKQTQVHYVIGNHDYSILYFSKRVDAFPFLVVRDLHLPVKGSNKKFYFTHGYEFEVLANFAFMTIEEYENICQYLCDVRQTTLGKIESTVWSALHLQFTGKKFGEHYAAVEPITKPPEDRMKELHPSGKSAEDRMKPLLNPRNKIEELALSPVARSMLIGGEPGESIIFGHTHSPFITEDKMVANSGSWVTDNDFHDTYIKIDDSGDLSLQRYSQ
jgi:UDP-2,3-diacylglucosamine pyrophosphatase LpxH